MNSETEMQYEHSERQMPAADERKPRQGRKPWITPVVSHSPVNEVTLAAVGTGTDLGIYS